MNKVYCRGCIYWECVVEVPEDVNWEDDKYEEHEGYCLRYPPLYTGESPKGDDIFTRPIIANYDWCGEFKQND